MRTVDGVIEDSLVESSNTGSCDTFQARLHCARSIVGADATEVRAAPLLLTDVLPKTLDSRIRRHNSRLPSRRSFDIWNPNTKRGCWWDRILMLEPELWRLIQSGERIE